MWHEAYRKCHMSGLTHCCKFLNLISLICIVAIKYSNIVVNFWICCEMNITMNKHDISLQFNAHILNLKISTKLTQLCIPVRSSHPSNSVTLMTLLGHLWSPSNCSPSITYPPATFCSEAPTFHSLPSCPKYHQEASCPKQHQQGIHQCLVYPTNGRRNFMEEQASMNASNPVLQRKSRVSM